MEEMIQATLDSTEKMEKEIGWILRKNISTLKKLNLPPPIFYTLAIGALCNHIAKLEALLVNQGLEQELATEMIQDILKDSHKKAKDWKELFIEDGE